MGKSATNDVKDPTWRVTLLGKVRVVSPRGESIPILGRKPAVLFGLLCLEPGKVHTREALAQALWPTLELAERQIRLRHELATLRKLIGTRDDDGPLLATRTGASVMAEKVTTDLQRLHAAWQKNTTLPTEDVTLLTEIVTLYQGELLEEGDGLCAPEQQEAGQIFTEAAWKLALLQRQNRQPDAAIALLRRLSQRDPLREEVQLALMELFSETGQTAAVHHQCLKWEGAWKDRMGTPPPPHVRERALALTHRSDAEVGKRASPPRLPASGWAKVVSTLFGS